MLEFCNRSCQAASSSGRGLPVKAFRMMKEPSKTLRSKAMADRAGEKMRFGL